MTTKILILDIETRPATAYVWSLFGINVGINQIEEPGGTICVGAKWLGEKETIFHSDWTDGHEEMIKAVHELISEADAVITYNGDKFDLPKLNGEFLIAGLAPPPPVTSIDVYKAVKKLGFLSNKLAFIGPMLGLGNKIAHEGFGLWTAVMKGDKKAEAKMQKYCVQDVVLLEKVYIKVKPYIKNHAFLGERSACGACNGNVLHKRGYRRTKTFKIERLQCQTCGSWQDGQRTKIG